MKKKQISLEKKLMLNKETIADLNAQQTELLAGGAAKFTRPIECGVETNNETCVTFRPTRPFCEIC